MINGENVTIVDTCVRRLENDLEKSDFIRARGRCEVTARASSNRAKLAIVVYAKCGCGWRYNSGAKTIGSLCLLRARQPSMHFTIETSRAR